jgi:phosphoribosylanthranilate isomerase
MKLKVCGMKHNILEVAELQPDYLGFIFWEPSKRFFEEELPQVHDMIKKVGVFVDAPVEDVLEKIKTHDLKAIQLHGKESPEFCTKVTTALNQTDRPVAIIKVFSIKDDFDFDALKPYEEVCDFYLFDTKGKLPGGNGYTFDWKVLNDYPSTKRFFLSGGIGLGEIESIKNFMQRPESKYCHAIDVNSRFEIEPGMKNIEQLKKFKKLLNTDH